MKKYEKFIYLTLSKSRKSNERKKEIFYPELYMYVGGNEMTEKEQTEIIRYAANKIFNLALYFT
jgi:hypothetical protein